MGEKVNRAYPTKAVLLLPDMLLCCLFLGNVTGGLCSFLLILIAWSIRFFLPLQNAGILGNQIAEHVCEASPFVGTVKYYAQIHLQVWQNSVCTGQGNLPLIT